jgi:hydrogenase-4 component J
MEEKVIFFQLTHKFVNRNEAVPEGPRQVIYYSLAIGHHVGVMDCFQTLFEIPLEEYRTWLLGLPQSAARHKLEGLLKWGEIEINHGHANDLIALLGPSAHAAPAEPSGWQGVLLASLKTMLREPALYLMVRRSA